MHLDDSFAAILNFFRENNTHLEKTFFSTVGQKIKKKSRPKTLVKSNKSISRKKVFNIFHEN